MEFFFREDLTDFEDLTEGVFGTFGFDPTPAFLSISYICLSTSITICLSPATIRDRESGSTVIPKEDKAELRTFQLYNFAAGDFISFKVFSSGIGVESRSKLFLIRLTRLRIGPKFRPYSSFSNWNSGIMYMPSFVNSRSCVRTPIVRSQE